MAATKVFSDFAILLGGLPNPPDPPALNWGGCRPPDPSAFPEGGGCHPPPRPPHPRIMRGFAPQTPPRKSEKLLERACNNNTARPYRWTGPGTAQITLLVVIACWKRLDTTAPTNPTISHVLHLLLMLSQDISYDGKQFMHISYLEVLVHFLKCLGHM